MAITNILILIIGIAVGFALGWLLKKNNPDNELNDTNANQLNETIASLNARIEAAKDNYKEQKDKIDTLSQQKDNLISDNSQLKEANQNLEHKLKEHKDEVEQLQKKFTTEFENIANKLLKQNSTDFAEANQKRLSEILTLK